MKHALLTAVLVLAAAAMLYGGDGDGASADASAVEESTRPDTVNESDLTFADDAGDEAASPGSSEGLTSFGAGDFLRMVLVLGLVVLSIYVLFYFLKRAGGNGPRSDSALRVIGTTSLQGNRSVHLLEVGGRIFLVGSADQSVSLLSEITDSETIDALLLDTATAHAGASARRGFGDFVADMVRGAVPTAGRPVSPEEIRSAANSRTEASVASDSSDNDNSPSDGASFLHEQRSRLQHL